MNLVLTGDQNNEPQELTDAQVNHLRRLLGWLVCEYNLSDEGQRGIMTGLNMAVAAGADQTRAQAVLDAEVERVRHVPAYIRQAIRMLGKAVRDHDARSRVVDPALSPMVATDRSGDK